MDYSIENTLLTDKEMDVLKRKADDKLVDVLCTLVNESGRTFYGNLRFNMFTNDIIGVNDQISKLDDLIRSIDRMSTDELKELANTYNVKKYNELNDSLLAYEVEKALRLERENLNEKSISLSSTYTINYKNTFEYFFNDCISKVEVALAKEHDIDNMEKYRILRRAFKNIQENLNTLHSLIDTMSVPATLLTDYNEELIDCESNIKELQDKLNLSYDYNEVVELENSLKLANEKRKNLKDAIKVQRENIINIYSSGNVQLDFSNMRTEILRCMIEVTSNSKEAFENNVLNKEDFFTEENGIQIDKCSRAFQSFFYEIIDKEFAYKNYLDENEIVLNNQLRSHSSRFFNRSQESAKDKDSTKDENIIHVEKLDQPMAGLNKPEYTTGTVDIIKSIKNQVELGKELDKEQTSTIGDIGEFVDSITATEKEMHPEKVVAYCECCNSKNIVSNDIVEYICSSCGKYSAVKLNPYVDVYPTEKDTIDISNNLKNRADEIAKSKSSANSTDNKTILGMSTIETYKPKTIESSVEPDTPEVPEAQITPEPESSTEVPASSDDVNKPSQGEETKNSVSKLQEKLLNLYDSVQPDVNSLGDMIACKKGLIVLYDKNGNVIISVTNGDYSLVSQIAQNREPQTQENVNNNDSKLDSMFNQVYSNRSLMPLPLDDVEGNVIENEPSVSEGENDNSQEPEEENTISSFKDVVISYCNNTGESIINKIKEIKDNAADKIAAQKIKAKAGAEKGFKFVISKAKELYQNDQNRYEAIKNNFAEKNILTLAKTKVAKIKQGMINEYEDKSGGRAI